MRDFFKRLFGGIDELSALLCKIAPFAWAIVLFSDTGYADASVLQKVGMVAFYHVVALIAYVISRVVDESKIDMKKSWFFVCETVFFFAIVKYAFGEL